jgi:membrane-bound serine protease (ClpP class)
MIWWALLLFSGGLVLLFAEFLLPGGICGIAGVLLLIVSGMLGVMAAPGYGLPIILGETAAASVAMGLGLWTLSRGKSAAGLRNEATMDSEQGYVSAETNAALLGQAGTVYSALRPSGVILVNGERVDAVADGAFIDQGRRVRVIETHGSRVVVEAIADDAS